MNIRHCDFIGYCVEALNAATVVQTSGDRFYTLHWFNICYFSVCVLFFSVSFLWICIFIIPYLLLFHAKLWPNVTWLTKATKKLINKTTQLNDKNFIIQMLYKNSYLHMTSLLLSYFNCVLRHWQLSIVICVLSLWQLFIKEHMMTMMMTNVS